MKYDVTRAQYVSSMCFVCGTDNEVSLKAQFLETVEGEVLGVFQPGEVHQSYPGRVHGGVSAAMLDELMGRAVNIEEPETWSVTVDLSTKYRKPVPYDQPVQARARVTKNGSRMYEAAGEIVLPDGTIAVEATGRYLKMSIDKIVDSGDVQAEVDEVIYPDSRPIPSFLDLAGGQTGRCC